MGGARRTPHAPLASRPGGAGPLRGCHAHGTSRGRVKRLWAPWRMTYIAGPRAPGGCVLCDAPAAGDDRARLVLHRGVHAYLILNAYPYACGHLMAVVYRHISTLAEATADELSELMGLAARATVVLGAEYRPDGFNVGINVGAAAGAGIAGHLHLHVVPRWTGDANFMAVVGEVHVLPETLEATYDRLKGRLGD
jgi:ATP adenylyltransferase